MVSSTKIFPLRSYVTVNAIQQTLQAPPRISVSLGRRIYAQTTGFISQSTYTRPLQYTLMLIPFRSAYRSGFFSLGSWGMSLPHSMAMSDRSALTVGATTANRDGTGWTVETQAGLIDTHLSADYSFRIMGIKLKIGVATGLSDDINAFIDADAKVSNTTRVGYSVQAEFAGGLSARLRLAGQLPFITNGLALISCRFSRLGQRVIIPIVLAPNVNPYLLFGFTAIPAAGYVAFDHFYLSRRRRRRVKE